MLNNTQIQVTLLDSDSDEMRFGALTVNQGAGWQRMSWQLSTGAYVGAGNNDGFQWTAVRRIQFFVWGGNGVATGIFRMDEMQFYNSTLAAPVIVAPVTEVFPYDAAYTLEWNSIAGAALYEIWTDDGPVFVNAGQDAGTGWVESWSSTNSADITIPESGTWHNKVRAWTADPAAGGSCSLWSNAESVDITITPRLTGDIDGCFISAMLPAK